MFAELNRPALVSRVGSLLSVSLLTRPADMSRGPRAAAAAMDFAAQRALQISAQQRGVYFHPSPIEPWFLSTAHSAADLDQVVAVVRDALVSTLRVPVSGGNGDAPLELLRETAGRSPQAVIFAEDSGNTTAQDLVDLAVTRLEAYRQAGIGPGCRVGAVAWPAASFVADVLAVLALDAVVVPLPRQMSEWERGRNEDTSRDDAPGRAARLAAAAGAGAVVAGERLIARKAPGEAPPGGAASAQLTSGTSGRTQVALRPVSALMAEAENYRTVLDLGPDTVLACPIPLHHAYGFGLAALAAPLAGATTLVTSADRHWMLSRALNEHGVTLVAGVPPLLRLLAEATTGRPTRRIGYLTAGMPMDPRTAELVGTVLGGWLGEVYGTTETGPICVRPPGPWQEVHSLGQPLDGVRIDLRPVEPGPQPSGGRHGRLALRSGRGPLADGDDRLPLPGSGG